VGRIEPENIADPALPRRRRRAPSGARKPDGLRDDTAGQKNTMVGDVKEWGVMLAEIASFLSASLP